VARREVGLREAGVLVTASDWPDPPEGFVLRTKGDRALYVAAPAEAEVDARGLQEWKTWDRELRRGSKLSGRGATAVVVGASGTPWRLKAMRRGGLLARVWHGRYPSARRLVATLAASAQARARGVPTAAPIALIVEAGAFGFARGAMALEEIGGAEDLAHRTVRGVATPADVAATIAPGPLPFSPRQSALRRLERSCAKLTGMPGPFGPGSEDLWYTLYAGDDAALARRLAAGRRAGRLSLAVHRLGWRRNAP